MILAFRPFSRAIATNAGSATPAIADFEDTAAKVLCLRRYSRRLRPTLAFRNTLLFRKINRIVDQKMPELGHCYLL